MRRNRRKKTVPEGSKVAAEMMMQVLTHGGSEGMIASEVEGEGKNT